MYKKAQSPAAASSQAVLPVQGCSEYTDHDFDYTANSTIIDTRIFETAKRAGGGFHGIGTRDWGITENTARAPTT